MGVLLLEALRFDNGPPEIAITARIALFNQALFELDALAFFELYKFPGINFFVSDLSFYHFEGRRANVNNVRHELRCFEVT